MASTKKPRSADLAVGLSGGVDSVVLLHLLHSLQPKFDFALSAVHVHHGLSPNADAWARFCTRLCKRLGVPLIIRRVKVQKKGKGLEAAARDARYAAFRDLPNGVVALAHHLDDQAETVLMNLLRGTGVRGASGMQARSRLGAKTLLRPLLGISRKAIEDYARVHKLEWIEDESNADEALTRNFVRRRLAPLIESRYPAWKESLARAATHFAKKELDASDLLRAYLREKGLKSPSEARLAEMLKQLTSGASGTQLRHDGAMLRTYRGHVYLQNENSRENHSFRALAWRGERRIAIPALNGEVRFKPGQGIAAAWIAKKDFVVRMRRGGERLQLDARRPRRTLKNLFQEAGVPHWLRDRVPLIFCGDELVWVAGLGVDVRYRGRGLVPQWHPGG